MLTDQNSPQSLIHGPILVDRIPVIASKTRTGMGKIITLPFSYLWRPLRLCVLGVRNRE